VCHRPRGRAALARDARRAQRRPAGARAGRDRGRGRAFGSDSGVEMTSRFDARELDYELPEERIAQAPLPERDAARLLCMGEGGALAHRSVRDLPELLAPSLIVVNDTRVIPARLFGHKPSGGKVELLLYERLSKPGASERWLALGKASKGLRE